MTQLTVSTLFFPQMYVNINVYIYIYVCVCENYIHSISDTHLLVGGLTPPLVYFKPKSPQKQLYLKGKIPKGMWFWKNHF